MPKKHYAYLCAALALLFGVTTASAHYPFLIGDRSPDMGHRGGIINLTYGLGELHEDVFVTARTPDWVRGYTFDGDTFELTDKLQKKGEVFTIKYRSRRIGDTWVVAHVPMTWSKHDSTFTETTVRTVIHQGLSRGWETPLGLPLEIVPLNQPYGLLPGDSFRVELLHNGEPLTDAKIYAEKYYDPPLQKPYPSESLLTRTSRTDRNGIANINLHSAGWWVLFVLHELDEMEKDGQSGVATLQDAVWIYVDAMPDKSR
ncbi:hypothetical protein MNBD_GAMMA17-589 [hydrothermal vent metagenome]|uniref:Additional periplasmic component NikK of nickel ECF transporter n=1 Tax=hydrothermal vent metagenome TaxID=652676 RepID=A0A3B0Z070_9ZZZZ